jgi:hypothetical protein
VSAVIGTFKITKVEHHDDYDLVEFNCGHTSHKFDRSIVEPTVSVSDSLTGEVVKISTLAADGVPVLVSGSSQVSKIASFSGFQARIDNTGQITNIENVVIHNLTQINNPSSTVTVNNIQEIIQQIDNSNYSIKNKKIIKDTLDRFDNELRSKPLTQVIGSLAKTIAPIAAPYVKMLVDSFVKFG